MPTAHVNHINLYYEVHGKGEPVFFISGFNGDHTFWTNMVDHYAKSYQVILIDNRGTGLSGRPDIPYTIEMMADDIAGLCKILNINAGHFIGLSMGGAIVQTLAFKYPALTHSIVLCNTFTQIDIRFALFAQGRLEAFKHNLSPLAVAKLTLGWGFSSDYLNQEGIVDFLIEKNISNPNPTTETGYKNQLHALMHFNSAGWIDQLKVPCLVIGSDQDMVASEPHMRQLAALIPNALYYCFKNTGHMPPIEQPDGFKSVVDKFLRSGSCIMT